MTCEPPTIKVELPATYVALFSLPYSMAVLLVEGKAGLGQGAATGRRA